MKIAIVGLGYVGLPLSQAFAESGVEFAGIDTDPTEVDLLNRGESYIRHFGAGRVGTAVRSRHFRASGTFDVVATVEAVIICLPTPLNKNRESDISYILKTGEAIAAYLRADGGRQEVK